MRRWELLAAGVDSRGVRLRIGSSDPARRNGGPTLSQSSRPVASEVVSLALARAIIGAHGGEVTLHAAPGLGVSVTARLPVVEARLAVGQ